MKKLDINSLRDRTNKCMFSKLGVFIFALLGSSFFSIVFWTNINPSIPFLKAVIFGIGGALFSGLLIVFIFYVIGRIFIKPEIESHKK